jgi:hypothetical protein
MLFEDILPPRDVENAGMIGGRTVENNDGVLSGNLQQLLAGDKGIRETYTTVRDGRSTGNFREKNSERLPRNCGKGVT